MASNASFQFEKSLLYTNNSWGENKLLVVFFNGFCQGDFFTPFFHQMIYPGPIRYT